MTTIAQAWPMAEVKKINNGSRILLYLERHSLADFTKLGLINVGGKTRTAKAIGVFELIGNLKDDNDIKAKNLFTNRIIKIRFSKTGEAVGYYKNCFYAPYRQ